MITFDFVRNGHLTQDLASFRLGNSTVEHAKLLEIDLTPTTPLAGGTNKLKDLGAWGQADVDPCLASPSDDFHLLK